MCTPNKKACLQQPQEEVREADVPEEDVEAEAATNTSIICIKKPATLNGLREVYEHYLVEKSCTT